MSYLIQKSSMNGYMILLVPPAFSILYSRAVLSLAEDVHGMLTLTRQPENTRLVFLLQNCSWCDQLLRKSSCQEKSLCYN